MVLDAAAGESLEVDISGATAQIPDDRPMRMRAVRTAPKLFKAPRRVTEWANPLASSSVAHSSSVFSVYSFDVGRGSKQSRLASTDNREMRRRRKTMWRV